MNPTFVSNTALFLNETQCFLTANLPTTDLFEYLNVFTFLHIYVDSWSGSLMS